MKRAVIIGLLLAACSGTASDAGGDGVLDCGDGQVAQTAGITASGAAEAEVAKVALKGWAANGATVKEFSEVGAWSAVQGGDDIAVAVPEQNADGGWKVSTVDVCGTPITGAAPLDGALDCVDAGEWSYQGILESSATGVDTAELALTEGLGPFEQQFGGEIVLVGSTTGSLVINQRELVVVEANELDDGTWVVLGGIGCIGYEAGVASP